MGILRSEKRDLGDPGEGFSRDEIPKVRNRFRAQTGVAQGFGGSQGGVSVGEEAGERLPQAADGLSFHLVLAKAGPGRGWLWKVEGIGQRLGFAREKQGGGVGGRGERKGGGGEKHNVTPGPAPALPLWSWGCACDPPTPQHGPGPWRDSQDEWRSPGPGWEDLDPR